MRPDPTAKLPAMFTPGKRTVTLDPNPNWVKQTLADLVAELEAAPSPRERLALLRAIVESPTRTRFPDEEDIRKGAALLHLVSVAIEEETLAETVYEIISQHLADNDSDLTAAYAIAAIYGVSPPFLLADFDRGRSLTLRLSTSPGNDATLPSSPYLMSRARRDPAVQEALERILSKNRAVSISKYALDAIQVADPAAFPERVSSLGLLEKPFLVGRVVDHLLACQTSDATDKVVALESKMFAENENSIPWVSERLASYGVVSKSVADRAVVLLESAEGLSAKDECRAAHYLCGYLTFEGPSAQEAREALLQRLGGNCSTTFAETVADYVRTTNDSSIVPRLRSTYASATPYTKDILADLIGTLHPEAPPLPSKTAELRRIDALLKALEEKATFDRDEWDRLILESQGLSAELAALRKASGMTKRP